MLAKLLFLARMRDVAMALESQVLPVTCRAVIGGAELLEARPKRPTGGRTHEDPSPVEVCLQGGALVPDEAVLLPEQIRVDEQRESLP